MGKHLQFGKGRVFFQAQTDGQDIPRDANGSHAPGTLFALRSSGRTAIAQGSRKYLASQRIIKPQRWEEGRAGSVCKKLVPALK